MGGRDADWRGEGDACELEEDILVGGNLQLTLGEFTEAGGEKKVGGLSWPSGVMAFLFFYCSEILI